MTGLSKAGVCKNVSGHCLFLIFSELSLCEHFFMFLVVSSGYVRNIISTIKNHWHSDISLVLLLVPATEIEDNRAIFNIWFHSFLLSEAGRMQVRLKSRWGPAFSSFFRAYFEWSLSTKLINIIVQSHLYSPAELPAEIQTGQKETDGLLRIPRVCLQLEQQACVEPGLCLMKGTH